MSIPGAISAVITSGAAANSAAVVAARRRLAEQITGEARKRLDALGSRAVPVDLYSAGGAEVYHEIARHDTSEVREVLALLRSSSGPVLELAAGTGRLTIPLLAAGHEVTAIDLSDPMLKILRERLAKLPTERSSRCKVVRFDMTQFRVRRRGGFAAALIGASSISLLDEAGRGKMFARVRKHLQPDGRFLLSTMAGPVSTEDEATTREGEDNVTSLEGGLTVYESWPEGRDVRVVTVFPSDPPKGPVFVYTSEVRVLTVETLTAELGEAGFRVVSARPVRGDFGSHPLTMMEAMPI